MKYEITSLVDISGKMNLFFCYSGKHFRGLGDQLGKKLTAKQERKHTNKRQLYFSVVLCAHEMTVIIKGIYTF